MPSLTQSCLKPAPDVALATPVLTAPNGIRYAAYGDTQVPAADLEHLVQAVPQPLAAALQRKTYYFVPLTLAEPLAEDSATPGKVMVASEFSTELSDAAICHRNVPVEGGECVFISTRLMQDRFALAFEFYINAGHHFVDAAGVPASFMDLVWSQAQAGVRGETSQDAWEYRLRAGGQVAEPAASSTPGLRASSFRSRRIAVQPIPPKVSATPQRNPVDEKARGQYLEAAFADAIAIYLLSLTVDFDYAELREREYPLLSPPALAERLRHIAELFPPNPGYEFSLRYRARG